MARLPVLKQDLQRSLALAYQAGDESAGGRLLQHSTRFIVSTIFDTVGGTLKHKPDLFEDFFQEASMGFLKAVMKYREDKNVNVISYAVHWMKAYLSNLNLRTASIVKMGTTQAQRKLFFSLTRTIRELEKDGVPPTDEELAKKLKVKTHEVTEMRQRMAQADVSRFLS